MILGVVFGEDGISSAVLGEDDLPGTVRGEDVLLGAVLGEERERGSRKHLHGRSGDILR